MIMFYPLEQEKRIAAEQEIMRSGESADVNLCQYRDVSCVRCCLPHIGGDPHMKSPGRYTGPRNIVMRFTNFNPLKDPRIEASQYEDSFPDAGKDEMERRFSERRDLFLETYNPGQPKQTLARYMEAAQKKEGYRYRPAAIAGPASMYTVGSVPEHPQKGELPECQLLGFVDESRRVGCLAHPLAETSRGYDGRDQVGFFHHTGCCRSVGCEASKEFVFLSPSALKVFDKAVDGMSWYEHSRHATSVLVYYLRSYDHILKRLDDRKLLDALTLEELVEFTNAIYDEWPLRNGDSGCMDSLEILSADMPLTERMMYIALGTRFTKDHFAVELQHARDCLERTGSAGVSPAQIRKK
jgi:hypothetical protein